jgi:hypothetical protein
MVAGVTAGGQIGVVSMTALRYAQADAGEVVVPVRPAELIYANFKHIEVRPDSRLEDGVPLYKLKILDTLIDHLSAKKPAPSFDAGSIDSTIIEMSRRMRAAEGGFGAAGRGLGASSGSGESYRAGFLPAPGAFVDLVA